MPYHRQTHGVYVTNGGSTITHGTPQKSGNYVGVAQKQKARAWSDGYSVQTTIDATEPYFLLTKGIVEVVNTGSGVSAAVKGDPIYITSGNLLTTTATANFPYGRVFEVAGSKGTPTGKVRIDLDAKTSAVAGAAF